MCLFCCIRLLLSPACLLYVTVMLVVWLFCAQFTMYGLLVPVFVQARNAGAGSMTFQLHMCRREQVPAGLMSLAMSGRNAASSATMGQKGPMAHPASEDGRSHGSDPASVRYFFFSVLFIIILAVTLTRHTLVVNLSTSLDDSCCCPLADEECCCKTLYKRWLSCCIHCGVFVCSGKC